jgi:hypothetical protein
MSSVMNPTCSGGSCHASRGFQRPAKQPTSRGHGRPERHPVSAPCFWLGNRERHVAATWSTLLGPLGPQMHRRGFGEVGFSSLPMALARGRESSTRTVPMESAGWRRWPGDTAAHAAGGAAGDWKR